MAGEFAHGSVGTELTQAEWEAVGAHVLDSQATGDIVYASSASQLVRLARGSDTHVLTLASGVPSWAAPAAAAAGSLTGATLASGVTASSLTSVGTIATGVWQGTDVGVAYGGTGVSTLADNAVLTGTGASAITAEANLTFDGSTLTLDGDLTFTGAQEISTSSGNLTLTAGGSTGDVLIGDGDGTILYVDGGTGTVAINGSPSSNVTLTLGQDFGEADTSVLAQLIDVWASETTGATGNTVRGALIRARIGGSSQDVTNNQNWTNDVGVRAIHAQVASDTGSSGTVTGIAALYVSDAQRNGATFTNQYGIYMEDLTSGGTDIGISMADDLDLRDTGTIKNVGASGNDWDSTSLRSGLITATVTGPAIQTTLQLRNLQAKANDVGPFMALYGHSTGQAMAYIHTVWAQESSPADSTTLNFSTRSTGDSLGARMTIHGNGDTDLLNNDLKNVGASGNDWTTANFEHSGTTASFFKTTSAGTNSVNAPLRVHHYSSGDMTANFGSAIQFNVGDSGAASVNLGWLGMSKVGGTGDDDNGYFVMTILETGSTYNDAFKVSGVGVGSFDLAGDDTGNTSLFDDYDDPMELQRYTHMQSDRFTNAEERQISLDRMVDMGVVSEVPGASSGYHMNLQPMVRLLAGGIYQNRERMDAQNEAMNERLARIEEALGV